MVNSLRKFACVITALLCVITLCSCNNKTEGKTELVDFADETIYVAAYNDVSIAPYLVAIDESGNRYVGTATVTDESGNPVNVEFNLFEASSYQTYSVVITVEVSAEDVRKRTISVIALDGSAPIITFSNEPGNSRVGTEYVLPEITAVKSSGEVFEPIIEIVLVDGKNEIKQTVENGKFTPSRAGSYKMTVTVTDKLGTVTQVKKVFVIKSSPPENTPEDPVRDDPYVVKRSASV